MPWNHVPSVGYCLNFNTNLEQRFREMPHSFSLFQPTGLHPVGGHWAVGYYLTIATDFLGWLCGNVLWWTMPLANDSDFITGVSGYSFWFYFLRGWHRWRNALASIAWTNGDKLRGNTLPKWQSNMSTILKERWFGGRMYRIQFRASFENTSVKCVVQFLGSVNIIWLIL